MALEVRILVPHLTPPPQPSPAAPSPEDGLQLRLSFSFQLQLLFYDLLHPGHCGHGFFPPGGLQALVLLILVGQGQEDLPVLLLESQSHQKPPWLVPCKEGPLHPTSLGGTTPAGRALPDPFSRCLLLWDKLTNSSWTC